MSITNTKGYYTAQRGDTIDSVARKLGMPAIMLSRQNPKIGNRKLEPGEQIFYNISPQYGGGTLDLSVAAPDSESTQQQINKHLASSGLYLKADTLEEAMEALKKEAGLADLSDEEAAQKALEFQRQNAWSQIQQSGAGKVYDPGKLIDNFGYGYSDITKQILANITGDKSYLAQGEMPDLSKMSAEELRKYAAGSNPAGSNMTKKEKALLAMGELMDAVTLKPLEAAPPDTQQLYNQALEEAQADYALRILNAVNSLNTKRRNIRNKKETNEEKYLKNLNELNMEIEEQGEDALQDSIRKGTARSSILDGRQEAIAQSGEQGALQLKTDFNNAISRLDRELKDIESAGKATLDLLEQNKQRAAQKEYEKQLKQYQQEQAKIAAANEKIAGSPLSSDEVLKQLDKLGTDKTAEFLKNNEKKLRNLWGSQYDKILKQYS